MTDQKFAHRPEDLLSEMRERVLVLTINRQKSYNSWTNATRDELMRKLLAADEDENVETHPYRQEPRPSTQVKTSPKSGNSLTAGT